MAFIIVLSLKQRTFHSTICKIADQREHRWIHSCSMRLIHHIKTMVPKYVVVAHLHDIQGLFFQGSKVTWDMDRDIRITVGVHRGVKTSSSFDTKDMMTITTFQGQDGVDITIFDLLDIALGIGILLHLG